MSEADTHIAAQGPLRTVEYAVRNDESMPAREFIRKLEPGDRAEVFQFLQHLADNGEQAVSNSKRFKKEREGLWAYKKKAPQGKRKNKGKRKSQMMRIPCFREGRRWILTHGFWKPPQSKWPEAQFALAFEIMNEQLAREARWRKENVKEK